MLEQLLLTQAQALRTATLSSQRFVVVFVLFLHVCVGTCVFVCDCANEPLCKNVTLSWVLTQFNISADFDSGMCACVFVLVDISNQQSEDTRLHNLYANLNVNC